MNRSFLLAAMLAVGLTACGEKPAPATRQAPAPAPAATAGTCAGAGAGCRQGRCGSRRCAHQRCRHRQGRDGDGQGAKPAIWRKDAKVQNKANPGKADAMKR